MGFSLLTVAFANAQYYYDNNYYYNNYNNPNNGVVSFVPGYSNYNNYGYNYGYYTNNIQPVSVSSLPYNYDNYSYNNYNYNYNCNAGYGYNCNYYNFSSLTPTTYAATNAYQSSATVNGYVTVSGGSSGQTYGTTWFQYGVNQNSLNWSTNPASVYSSTNTNANLTGLNCGTVYYFRAVTSGSNGMQYGNTLSFTTTQCNYNNYNYNYGYGNYYPNYNYQTWVPPQIQTRCYKTTKKVRYYR